MMSFTKLEKITELLAKYSEKETGNDMVIYLSHEEIKNLVIDHCNLRVTDVEIPSPVVPKYIFFHSKHGDITIKSLINEEENL